ncbi:MAG: plastocyanin/azurin family copper-binding protein [Gemmatimonadales bacterium]
MSPRVGSMALALLVSASLASRGSAQTTHVVRLVAEPGKHEYHFDPSVVTVKPNDIVVFRVVSGAPHSVVFEGAGLSSQARGALNAALVRRAGDLSSPLLTSSGTEYRLVVPALDPGSYPFYCLPHRAYDMRGELQVQ